MPLACSCFGFSPPGGASAATVAIHIFVFFEREGKVGVSGPMFLHVRNASFSFWEKNTNIQSAKSLSNHFKPNLSFFVFFTAERGNSVTYLTTDPDRPGRAAFFVVITWEKFRSSFEFFTFYGRSLKHETICAKSFTGCRHCFVTYAYVFTFLGDDSSVNRAGGNNSC